MRSDHFLPLLHCNWKNLASVFAMSCLWKWRSLSLLDNHHSLLWIVALNFSLGFHFKENQPIYPYYSLQALIRNLSNLMDYVELFTVTISTCNDLFFFSPYICKYLFFSVIREGWLIGKMIPELLAKSNLTPHLWIFWF